MIANLDRVNDMMKKEGLDGLVAFSSSNVFYLTGYHSMLAILSKTPSFFAAYPRGGEPSLILPSEEEGLFLTGEFRTKNRHYFGESFGSANEKPKSEGDPFDLVAKSLRSSGVAKGRIGYDGKIAPVFLQEQLRKALPSAELVEATNFFQRLRMVKSEEEIHRLRESLGILEYGIKAAFKATREGTSEREFVYEFKKAALQKQPDSTFLHLEAGFGPRGGLGGGTFPSDNLAKVGDTIHFDGGILYNQYCSDTCRNAVLGKASDRQRRLYEALYRAEQEAIGMLKPGARIPDIYRAAVKTVRAGGYPDYQADYVGHMIGLEGHEWPSLGAGANVEMQENMVVMIEVPYYDPSIGAYNPEDCVLVTKDGPEYITQMERKLYEL
jgi:Xaa-Pro dipeptidase